jgi:transcriptional regulator GlxA family with amidase domain
MEIAIVLFDRFTALDVIGPYQVLAGLPNSKVTFVASAAGIVADDVGSCSLVADTSMKDVANPDVVVVPGGPGQVTVMDDELVLSWLRTAHRSTTWTTSVCTGSLILGAAGILRGKRATSHWLALDQLQRFGASPVSERVVIDGKVMTAAGVSAGIDMALALVGKIASPTVAQTIQLAIEYDPEPPFDGGSPAKALPQVRAYLESNSRFILEGKTS